MGDVDAFDRPPFSGYGKYLYGTLVAVADWFIGDVLLYVCYQVSAGKVRIYFDS